MNTHPRVVYIHISAKQNKKKTGINKFMYSFLPHTRISTRKKKTEPHNETHLQIFTNLILFVLT